MRRPRWAWALGALGLAVEASGCDALWSNSADDCELTLTCERHRGRWDETPVACVPSENASAVDDGCGVFVSSSGADRNPGTKGLPLKTLREALLRAEGSGNKRVYACAGTFEEAVEVTHGVTIYGGLDCASGWGWAGEQRKTVLTAGVGEIPLVVRGGGGEGSVRVEDVHVKARGIGPDEQVEFAGVSSIAALAEEANVELARCVLEAGDAAAGEAGAAYSVSAPRSTDGKRGGPACSEEIVDPGGSVENDCGTPDDPSDDSLSGAGGIGQANSGSSGDDGSPGDLANGGKGEGADVCAAGTAGKDGGEGGPGAGATGLGEISARGFSGAAGREGAKGGTAQGGGGGGGSKGGAGEGKCMSDASAGGASGGSGGAGGCGGAGGRGGSAGGASIALISLNARLSFEQVTLKTGRGGAGGKGGAGQEGGDGGAGGPGGEAPVGAVDLHDGCAGGSGGKGGAGGPGGGGLGGHALGIAYKGAAPPVQGGTIELGEAGPGGAGADAEGEGAAGVKAEVQAF
ncbi:PGRS family protein [Sorangium sp. So ce1151]|uniref:PGRS family protein n=1 Tax=Sorangium sp. So ce1151 TaxID=3133332 RepID=UPI003F5E37EF